jgi:DNA-binding transcriptional ArsR family regulator
MIWLRIYMEAALRAISEPHRREIIRLVRERELPAGRIAAHFDMTREGVSRHLRVLKEAGLVTERREGTRRLYAARVEGLAEVRAFLEDLWTPRLELLKAEAERREKRRAPGDR